MVCQNLASCYITKTITTTLAAQLDVCNKLSYDDHPLAEVAPNLESGEYCCLFRRSPDDSVENRNFYTRPLAKSPSFPRFNEKSLELCTENLGSETGCDVVTYSCGEDISLPLPSFNPSTLPHFASPKRRVDLEKLKQQKESSLTKRRHDQEKNSSKNAKNFPPPLTTMSGSNTLQICSRKEGGRLILEAVEAPFRNSYMQAERSGGRLTIWLLTGAVSSVTSASSASAEEESYDKCGDEAAEEEEADGSESKKEEIDGERDKFHGLNRCKEGRLGGEGMCSDWKPALWVATS